MNKLPEKKYSFYEYRQLKEIYNADIVVQLELHQTIDIVDTLNGDFEYKLSSILDASYISTIDNSIIYNEDLKNNNAFFDKIPFFESNIQLQKTIKNSYIELTNIAIK